MYNLGKIVGKKVVAIKAFCTDKRRTKYVEPEFILFDDGKTLIQLEEQDYYSYHDCSSSARHITVREDKKYWKQIMDNVDDSYPDATEDI